ncbi:hypothetical protein HJFPF1_09766 [Paramyrothecium foliicola]|nr:hypothetical protein HJFPF1_09766 [Paramyrothecium foliicola]
MEDLKRKGSKSNDERESRDSKRLRIVQPRIQRRNRRKSELLPGNGQRCCSKCSAMTGTWEGLGALLSKKGYEHHNWYDMQEAAAQGCPLCEHMFEVLEHEDWEFDEADGSVTRKPTLIWATVNESYATGRRDEKPGLSLFDGLQLLGIEVFIPLDPGLAHHPDRDGQLYHMITHPADPCSHFVPGKMESKELSTEMVSKLRLWLDECVNRHAACPRHTANTLPRRILEVGDENTPIRLHQSRQNEKGSYATLSYCWGKNARQLMTTRATIQEHMVTVAYEHLPRTIQDAVRVCRVMGIDYLWVDALCIVQDDDDDKLDQIAQMGSIYKRSTVTLVAAGAESVNDGFLEDAKHRPSMWEDLSLPHKPVAELPILVGDGTFGTVFMRPDDSDLTRSSSEPIFRRGWTFQELALSPRVVMFDSHQITLKCRECDFRPVFDTHVNFEFHCFDLPASVFGLDPETDLDIGRSRSGAIAQQRLLRDQERIWSSIIEEYSCRDLKIFSDRLPGLAGIVTELHHAWGDAYLAGFWQRCIVQHLGWFRYSTGLADDPEPFQDMDRSQRIGLPSWSWVTAPYRVLVESVRIPDARREFCIIQSLNVG